jgi:hypothetical protein
LASIAWGSELHKVRARVSERLRGGEMKIANVMEARVSEGLLAVCLDFIFWIVGNLLFLL